MQDDEAQELLSLLREVNSIDTLSLKYSTVNKILDLIKPPEEMSFADKVKESKQMSFRFNKKANVNQDAVCMVETMLQDLKQLVADREFQLEELMDE